MGIHQNSGGIGVGCCFQQKTCNVSETEQDRMKVTYALSIGAKINDLG